jgi:hypothetical protein
VDHHETAAADIACARIGDRKREADCDCCIDGIPASIEDFNADARSAAFLRNHDAIAGMNRLRGGNVGRARDRRDLGRGRSPEDQ